MANSHDPHRPFVGSRPRKRKLRPGAAQKAPEPAASRIYEPGEVVVPAFLPDIPNVRKEVAQYFGSVHRCDETVGAVLSALSESGLADNTLVMFFSDHGMAFPFAKTNCYFSSTRTPWMCRWPGRTRPGTVEREHFISGIDFMPTILSAAGLAPPAGMDGKSFLPLLTGGRQAGREEVFTVFHETAGRRKYPMRCLQDRRFGYIYNAWADGKTVFRNESQSGLSMNAMRAAARTDEGIAARVKLFLYRVPEELYDFASDPAALKNLIDEPRHKDVLKKMRAAVLAIMTEKKDPLTETFRKFLGGLGA
jgi:N-sulfoglucosamine sulfohydrolase